MPYYLYYFILLLILQSCTSPSSEKSELKELEQEVLKQHDETMSQMDKMMQLQRTLQVYVKQPPAPTADTILIKERLRNLKLADEAMMSWMHQYKSPDSLSPAKAKSYLQEQLTKINQVKKLTDNALQEADIIRNQYETSSKK